MEQRPRKGESAGALQLPNVDLVVWLVGLKFCVTDGTHSKLRTGLLYPYALYPYTLTLYPLPFILPHSTLLFGSGAMRSPNSSSCPASTVDGASHIRSAPLAVLGKAITSRMFDSPAMSAMMRSYPNAMPPCGGVPYSNASRKNPNRSLAFSSVSPIMLKILF